MVSIFLLLVILWSLFLLLLVIRAISIESFMCGGFILSYLYSPPILAYFGHRIGARYYGFTYGQASFLITLFSHI